MTLTLGRSRQSSFSLSQQLIGGGSGSGGEVGNRGPSDDQLQFLSTSYGSNKSGFAAATKKTNRDTSSIPCKFYRNGKCSAGWDCVFSHSIDGHHSLLHQSLENNSLNICKFFLRGSCKFGSKCALLHVFPECSETEGTSLFELQQHQNVDDILSDQRAVSPIPTSLLPPTSATKLPSPESIKYPTAPLPIRFKSMPDIFRWSADQCNDRPSGNFLFYSSFQDAFIDNGNFLDDNYNFLLGGQSLPSDLTANFDDLELKRPLEAPMMLSEFGDSQKNISGLNERNRASANVSCCSGRTSASGKTLTFSSYFDSLLSQNTEDMILVIQEDGPNDLLGTHKDANATAISPTVSRLKLTERKNTPDIFSPFPEDFSDTSTLPNEDNDDEKNDENFATPLGTFLSSNDEKHDISHIHHGDSILNEFESFITEGNDEMKYLNGIDHGSLIIKSNPMAEFSELRCEICKQQVMAKGKFGIMVCEHTFCLSCIRSLRASRISAGMSAERIQECPTCSTLTPYVVPSFFWVNNPKQKQVIFMDYQMKISDIPCKFFNFGNSYCPFGENCYYSHTTSKPSLHDSYHQTRCNQTTNETNCTRRKRQSSSKLASSSITLSDYFFGKRTDNNKSRNIS